MKSGAHSHSDNGASFTLVLALVGVLVVVASLAAITALINALITLLVTLCITIGLITTVAIGAGLYFHKVIEPRRTRAQVHYLDARSAYPAIEPCTIRGIHNSSQCNGNLHSPQWNRLE